MKYLTFVGLTVVSAVVLFSSCNKPKSHLNMVLIPGGSFLMGDAGGLDIESPVHEVEVD